MRIGPKLTISLLIPVALLMILFAAIDDVWSRARLRQELVREGRSVARTVQVAMEDYFRDRDLAEARDLVDKISAYERVLGLRIFNPDGTLNYQSRGLEDHPFMAHETLARVIEEKIPLETERKIGEDPAISFLFPLSSADGTVVGAVQLLQLGSFVREEAIASRRSIAGLTAVMIAAITLIILLVTWFSVTRPSRELVRSFRDVGSGDLLSRVPERGDDEFGRLAREFNAMCERLQSARHSLMAEQEERRHVEADLRKAEQMAGLGRLAAGLAHQIGTPLNVIGGRADALRRSLRGDAESERKLRIIVEQIARITRTVRGMLDFASRGELRLVTGDALAVLRGILEFMEPSFEEKRIRVETSYPGRIVPAAIDKDQISEVFLNLVKNAVEAMPGGGVLRVGARVADRPHPEEGGPARPFLEIRVEDTGAGIDPEHLARVFDPFFTTKDVGEGTGLGLSVSYGIVREHGGWIGMESTAGIGTCVTVLLPAEQPAPGEEA
ncbi:MAG: ATP-binding protein [Candidatus Eisenbacteria bacterium]